ncbi:MAG: tRNA (N6-isopentenyl adenosine(37)-C2)-methylthiotransferase MiaB [bacterium]
MNKKVYIETLGCQMNKSDTERILGILELEGYEETKDSKAANLLIINTCSIRGASEDKAYSHLGVWGKRKRKNPEMNIKIAMCGCVAQQTKEQIFRRAPYVDLIFGTHNIDELPKLIKKVEEDEKVCSIHKTQYKDENGGFMIKRKEGISAWLPIIEGCDYFCTYCVVPHTRGRQRSRLPQEIINEAREIAKEGFKEIILLGQTVDSYGKDLDDETATLSYLLKEINKIDEVIRIRFLTSHPADMDEELIKTVAGLDKVCEYFHIPMQSGSDAILEKMRRPYTRAEFLDLVNMIKKYMPEVGITSDFIAGFPGETEEDFNDTLSIIDEVVFDYCNGAAYSPRRQTPAAVWKNQLPTEEKKQRLYILNDKIKEAIQITNDRCVGKTMEILVDGVNEKGELNMNGRTRSNKIVHFIGDKSLIGTLINVKITEAAPWCLKGEIV